MVKRAESYDTDVLRIEDVSKWRRRLTVRGTNCGSTDEVYNRAGLRLLPMTRGKMNLERE